MNKLEEEIKKLNKSLIIQQKLIVFWGIVLCILFIVCIGITMKGIL